MKGLVPRTVRHEVGSHFRRGGFATLTIGSLGIVYGDIGTSRLYAMDQLFFGRPGLARTPDDVLGGVSLVIWTITLLVAIKYAIFVLRAQNDGEGGVFALYGLLAEPKRRGTQLLSWLLMLAAGLLLADGMITPAINANVLEEFGVTHSHATVAVHARDTLAGDGGEFGTFGAFPDFVFDDLDQTAEHVRA